MANFVIKRDGRKEPFNIEKIKKGIVSAAIRANTTEKEAIAMAKKVAGLISNSLKNANEVLAAELRARIISALDAVAPKVSEEWKNYE